MDVEDQVRVLETKLETSEASNQKLQGKFDASEARCQSLSQELEKKKRENAQLMARLNEALSQSHFESEKVDTVKQQLQAQINQLSAQVRDEQAKRSLAEQKISELDALLRTRKDELDKKRNEMFELHNKVNQRDSKAMM